MMKIVSHLQMSSGSGFAGLTMPGDYNVQIITVISRDVNEYWYFLLSAVKDLIKLLWDRARLCIAKGLQYPYNTIEFLWRNWSSIALFSGRWFPCNSPYICTFVFILHHELYLLLTYSISRFAKRKLDESVFLGKKLQVSYAPQFESLHETKEKLEARRKEVLARLNRKYLVAKLEITLSNKKNSAFIL